MPMITFSLVRVPEILEDKHSITDHPKFFVVAMRFNIHPLFQPKHWNASETLGLI